MSIVLYFLAIVAANLITARTQPMAVGPFIVPWGTWLIGLVLVLRDFVQLRYGRPVAYAAILGALLASAATSARLGDPLAITAASALAFAVSESGETEIFTRLRRSLAGRIFLSGVTSSLLDSVVFIVIGLSPLTTGFVPWAFIPMAVLGQYIVKMAMVSLGAAVSRCAVLPRFAQA